MAFSFDEFPWSKYYDSDLREILEYLREFKDRLDSYDTTIAELQETLEGIEDMETAISDLETATADLSTIRSNISALQSTVTSLASTDADLQSQIDALTSEWDTITTLFENVYTYIDSKYALAISKLNGKIVSVYEDIGIIQSELQQQIDKLDSYIQWLIEHIATTVYNPLWAKDMSFKDNNAQIYRDFAYGALTVAEYQEQALTVDDYDERGLTVVRYYLYGRFDIAKAHWTVGPVSGIRKRVANALIEVVNFFANTLTSDEYDALALTSDAYDALALTVSQYYYYRV